MTDGGSLLTLTYYGAEKYIPNYNVMGVAKAGLEASVRYLAADMGPNNIRVNAINPPAIKYLLCIAEVARLCQNYTTGARTRTPSLPTCGKQIQVN